MNEDKRTSPRISLKARGILVDRESSSEIRTMDIGAGGVAVISEKPLPVGSVTGLTLKFYHDGGLRNISARCKICHCVYGAGGFKAGLAFLELTPSSIATLAKLMKGSAY